MKAINRNNEDSTLLLLYLSRASDVAAATTAYSKSTHPFINIARNESENNLKKSKIETQTHTDEWVEGNPPG